MVDVDASPDFAIALPPNARISALTFSPDALRIRLDDGGDRRVPADAVAAFLGARLRSEEVHPAPLERGSLMDKFMGKESVAIEETFQHVVAMRVASAGELWYLVAETFNFRNALGADSEYVFDRNLRLLVRRLVDFAPQAQQDPFIAALLGGVALPPAMDGLLEFLRSVSP